MISRSVSRAAAATLANYFPRTHPCPGFPRAGFPVLATLHVAVQALIMLIAQALVAVAGINLIKLFLYMNSYHKEQSDAFYMVRSHLSTFSSKQRQKLKSEVAGYLGFRKEVASFLSTHFSEVCTQKCYKGRLSACCSREGIITFFADVVVNALISQGREIDLLLEILKKPNNGFKCIYLSEKGCLWRLKPIVCEMFLCEHAKKEVFTENRQLEHKWEELKQREKLYTWPDRRVIFDTFESYFIEAGYSSPLMYMHNSPGLLRVKRKALSCAASCGGGD